MMKLINDKIIESIRSKVPPIEILRPAECLYRSKSQLCPCLLVSTLKIPDGIIRADVVERSCRLFQDFMAVCNKQDSPNPLESNAAR